MALQIEMLVFGAWHVSGIADPFNGHIDESSIAQVRRSDGWIATTWNNTSNPDAFAAAGAEERKRDEPPPLAGAGIIVCLMTQTHGSIKR